MYVQTKLLVFFFFFLLIVVTPLEQSLAGCPESTGGLTRHGSVFPYPLSYLRHLEYKFRVRNDCKLGERFQGPGLTTRCVPEPCTAPHLIYAGGAKEECH